MPWPAMGGAGHCACHAAPEETKANRQATWMLAGWSRQSFASARYNGEEPPRALALSLNAGCVSPTLHMCVALLEL